MGQSLADTKGKMESADTLLGVERVQAKRQSVPYDRVDLAEDTAGTPRGQRQGDSTDDI